MLDLKFIRQNPDAVKKAAKDKNLADHTDAVLIVDEQLRIRQSEWEELQARRKRLSKEIMQASPDVRSQIRAEVQGLKPRLEALDHEIKDLRQELDCKLLLLPSPPRADVPLGKDDRENKEIRKWGTLPTFKGTPLDHVDLGERLGIIDIPRGVKIAGSRSYVLRGLGARLERAVLQFAWDTVVSRGYEPYSVPVLVKENTMEGTGYFPQGRDQAYCVEKDQLALVGTSEVPMASLHSEEIIPMADLPKKFVALSHCFRREAGTYGKDTRGLYRVHQFQKVEQVILCQNDNQVSERLHEELLANAEYLMQQLEIPYRVVYVCSGDLGLGQIRKHDIEAWMPSRNAYCETHSCSTFHDFQSRRLKIRYADQDGSKKFCHTLNNTAIASPRILIPLLENHQTEDGKVRIPKVLRPYMDNREEI